MSGKAENAVALVATLGATADRDQAPRGRTNSIVELDDLPDAERDPFVRGAEEVAAPVPQRKAGHEATRVGIEEWCSLAREIRKHQQPVAAGRNTRGLVHERRERGASAEFLNPCGQGA